jgi:hypothetical protein
MANCSLTDIFSFQNQFWSLGIYLVGLAQRFSQLIVTIIRNSKFYVTSSYIKHEKCNFPKSSKPMEQFIVDITILDELFN